MRVFLSYSSSDQGLAERLRAAMLDQNIQVWDPVQIPAGGNIDDQVQEALRMSDLFVYLIPEKEGSGKWSLFELGAAKALGKRIVAVLPDGSRLANSVVAAKLANTVVLDEKKPSDTVRRILDKAA